MRLKQVRTPLIAGNARFTVYAPGCVRLEYADGGRFSPYAPMIAGRSLPRPLQARAGRVGDRLVLETERFRLEYLDDGKQFHPGNLRIIHANAGGSEEVWTPGKADTGCLAVVVRSLDNWEHQPDQCPVQGILSRQGGHLLENKGLVYWNKKWDWPQSFRRTVKFDGFFFAYGSDYRSALRDLVRVLGPIPMIPRWALGFWYSRWYPYRDRDFLDLVKRYRSEDIPIDVVMIDTDWRGGWAGYDWCRKYFPQPEETIAQLHKLGVKVGLNDHPGYDDYEPLPENDSHYKKLLKRLGPLPHQGEMVCDWSRPDAVAAWEEEILGPFFDQGVDFWWIDGWTRSQFGGNDPQLWLNQRYFELREKKTGKRGIILSRWGGPGSHRYPVQFSGDTYSNWETLREEIGFTADSCGLGAVYWSHDIGGFHNREVDEELFARWSQFGAFSPIFRTHSAFGVREPWKFSKWVLKSFRHYTRMRYALLPYLYNLVWEAHVSGLPIVRPLYLEMPEEAPAVYRARDQYLLGPFIMVVPAVGPGTGERGTYTAKAYFPRGRWYELEGKEVVKGGSYHSVTLPRDRIGLYVKEGAIIPCARVGENSTYDNGMIELDCYPAGTPSQYFVYQDDGESLEYRKGVYRLTPIRMEKKNSQVVLAIGPGRGRFSVATAWTLRLRVPDDKRVSAAHYRYGSGAWQKAFVSLTKDCLAGEVCGVANFAAAEIPPGEGKLTVRFTLE